MQTLRPIHPSVMRFERRTLSRGFTLTQKKSLKRRGTLKRQETLTTRDILKSMKSHDFDNVDDLAALDGVSRDNYAYYAGNLGFVGLGVALVGYFACQVVLYRTYLLYVAHLYVQYSETLIIIP